jgi:tRNA(Ile)-lysidine synthase
MSLESKLFDSLSPWRQAPAWRVALSGGLDSTVLLHLLVQLARREILPNISAIHVHHGLQAAAEPWPAHCQALCKRLDVPLVVRRVEVPQGASLERAAREARYAAFVEELGDGEVLLTAQHRDDQAETLLFRLLRGAGVRGLAGMPVSRALGRGALVRPLLQCSRAELEAYARAQGLEWVEDPSNADIRYARNYLRQQVMPLLTTHWPQAPGNLARSAAHLREAEELLAELARQDLAATQTSSPFSWLPLPSLELAPLLGLSPARQRNALRHWLAPLTELPDSDHWAGWRDLCAAAGDAAPIWRLARGELRRADGRLWWLAGVWLRPAPPAQVWDDPRRPLLLADNGWLYLDGITPSGPLQVRYRQGGEVLLLPGRGQRDLKRLLNESGLPAFARGRLPLLYRGEELLAVANLPRLDGPAGGEWRLRWQPPTNDQGLS